MAIHHNEVYLAVVEFVAGIGQNYYPGDVWRGNLMEADEFVREGKLRKLEGDELIAWEESHVR